MKWQREMTAIPTPYGGIVFRSRLEARWALFLDHLHVKWEYETQGFATGGTAYLPDFVVFAALGTLWTEIKPAYDNDPDGVARWRKFADQRPQPSRAALLIGVPAPENETRVIGGDINADDPVKGPWEDDLQTWRPCPAGVHFDLAYPGRFRSKYAEDGCPQRHGGLGDEAIADAVTAARSERFGR